MHYVNYEGVDGSDNWKVCASLVEAREFVRETHSFGLGAKIVSPSRVPMKVRSR